MGLRAMAAAIAAVQDEVSITDPVRKTAKAYPFLAPGKDSLTLPCFMNTYRLDNQVIQGGIRRQEWTCFTQLLVGESTNQPELDSEIAAAFLEALLEKFAVHLTLDDTVTLHRFRGEQERTLGVFEWNGLNYVGLDFAMEAVVIDTIEVNA